ncbi:MAG TPA: hypothetical protein VKN14_05615 [Flavobacteriaceae bacterium]|nr:hypothetical protein [Flavobacteriaceae bacterium]
MRDLAKRKQLVKDIAEALNKNCAENESDTPDFQLAEYMVSCLENYENITRGRDIWNRPECPENIDYKYVKISNKHFLELVEKVKAEHGTIEKQQIALVKELLPDWIIVKEHDGIMVNPPDDNNHYDSCVEFSDGNSFENIWRQAESAMTYYIERLKTRMQEHWPDKTLSPGEYLKEDLNTSRMSIKDMAECLEMSEEMINLLFNNKLVIDEELAEKLYHYNACPKRQWLDMEYKYRTQQLQIEKRKRGELVS